MKKVNFISLDFLTKVVGESANTKKTTCIRTLKKINFSYTWQDSHEKS